MPDATPTGVIIRATAPDGTERNITEGVQVLYDLVIQSMDWGSGFLTVEDVLPMVDLATFCGFKGYEEAEEYMANELKAEKQRQCPHPSWREEPYEPPSKRTAANRDYVTLTCEECGKSKVEPKWRTLDA